MWKETLDHGCKLWLSIVYHIGFGEVSLMTKLKNKMFIF